MIRSRRSTPVVVAAVLLTLALSSCSANQSGASDSAGGGPAGERMPMPGEPLTEEGSGASDGSEADAPGSSAVDRAVIVTASVSLSDPDPVAIADEVQEVAEDAGGRIDRRRDTPSAGSESASSELVLRVPSDELDDALADITDLATVVWSSVDRQDVTGSVTDITARIGALDASIDRLLDLLDAAGTTADLITIESELTTRQAERDSLAAQQESLADQVEFSTVTVQIGVPGEVGQAGPGDFWGGLVLGFASLGAFLSGLLVVIGVALPWLLLLAVIVALLWWGRRRRRAGAPVSSAPPRVQPASGPAPSTPSTPSPAPTAPTTPPAAAALAAASPVAATPTIPPRPPLPAPAAPQTAAPQTTAPQTTAPSSAAPQTRTPKTPAPQAAPKKPAPKAGPKTPASPKATTARRPRATPKTKDDE